MRYRISVEFDVYEDISVRDVDTINDCIEIIEEFFDNLDSYNLAKQRIVGNIGNITLEHFRGVNNV
jgi:hypothetical protein